MALHQQVEEILDKAKAEIRALIADALKVEAEAKDNLRPTRKAK